MGAEIITIVTAATSIILAMLTGIYVFLTYKMLKESKNVNELNRKTIERQFMLLTLPHLYCDVKLEINGVVNLKVLNTGNNYANDIDIFVFGCYDKSSLPALEKYFFSEDKNKHVAVNAENMFALFDRFTYAIFPFKKSVSADVRFPIIPSSLYILIQYRDIQGANYCQCYFFSREINLYQETNKYILSCIKPQQITLSERIDFDIDQKTGSYQFRTESGLSMPECVDGDLMILLDYVVPIAYKFVAVEDRGQWSSID